jgi:hypothetical protein
VPSSDDPNNAAAGLENETEAMASRRNRLSFRIPWLLEAVAEGPFAILVLLVLVILVLAARGVGWW